MDLNRFRLTRRKLIGVTLVAIALSATLVYVYYSMSVASVSGLTIDEVLADRNYVNGTYPKRIETFIIEVQVWSNAQSIAVRLDGPVFAAEADTVPLGSQSFQSGTIIPGSYLTYNLRFNINESVSIGYLSTSANFIGVAMNSSATAGFYSQKITTCGGASWNWTTATLILKSPSVTRNCHP